MSTSKSRKPKKFSINTSKAKGESAKLSKKGKQSVINRTKSGSKKTTTLKSPSMKLFTKAAKTAIKKHEKAIRELQKY